MSEAVNEPRPYEPVRPAPLKVGRGLLILAVVAAAVAAYGVVQRRSDEGQLAHWTQQQAVPAVSLISPGLETGTREVVLPGDVEAYFDASIHGQVSGYVSEWRADIGAQVHKGDVLAVIDTPELDDRISAAQGELAKANADLDLAKVTAASLGGAAQPRPRCRNRPPTRSASDRAGQERRARAEQANVDRLESAEGVLQHRRAVRRRGHRPQCRRRLAGEGRRFSSTCSASPTSTKCASTCARRSRTPPR